MQTTFPTVALFKEAARYPFKYPVSILASIGVFIVGFAIAMLVGALVITALGVDMAVLANIMANLQAGNFEGVGPILVGYLLAIYVALMAMAHIFNYWVTLGAHGAEAASWSLSEGRLSAAAVNALKLLLIGLLVGIINLVVILVLSKLSLIPSLEEQAMIVDFSDAALAGLTGNIIMVIVTCIIYSLFSANLTQTALRNTSEGLEHPHTVDFAIVLVLLYAIFLIPSTLGALTGSDVLTVALQLILGIHLAFTVPSAHGLRYRVCAAERDEGEQM